MSQGLRQPLIKAIDNAKMFRDLFRPDLYQQWEIAGSVRRKCEDVADIEHVIVPRVAFVKVGMGLFDTPVEKSLIWHRLDELLADGQITKKIYGNEGFKWGERQRGLMFQGIAHEMYTAAPESFGVQLAIRTGPWEFSRNMVTRLHDYSRRAHEGYVWECEKCVCDKKDKLCKACDGTGLVKLEKIIVRDERHYFDLCGLSWIPPERRR